MAATTKTSQSFRFSNDQITTIEAAKAFPWERPVPINMFWDSFEYRHANNFLAQFSDQEIAELPIDLNSTAEHEEKLKLLLQLLREKLAKEEAATTPPQSLHEVDYKKWSSLLSGIFNLEDLLSLPQAEETARKMVRMRQDESNPLPMYTLAGHLFKVGKYREAEENARPVVAWMDAHASLGKESPQALYARRFLAKTLWFQGASRRSEAEERVAVVHDIVDGTGSGKFAVYQVEERRLNREMMEELQQQK